jgi:hypothetical protein
MIRSTAGKNHSIICICAAKASGKQSSIQTVFAAASEASGLPFAWVARPPRILPITAPTG